MPKDICVEDIAAGLSKICRFNGQLDVFYTVAQHATLVASLVRPALAFPALNHDDSEAYLGDMSSKLKHARFMQDFRNLESRWEVVIEAALGMTSLNDDEHHEIKVADSLAFIYEKVTFQTPKAWEGEQDIEAAVANGLTTEAWAVEMRQLLHRVPTFLTPLDHTLARHHFLQHFHRYRLTWRR